MLSLSGDFSGSLMSLTDYQNKISALQNVSGHGSVQLAGVTIQVQQDTPVKLDASFRYSCDGSTGNGKCGF